ncbi:MAG: hypothetical protein QM756_11975 [Polyangiaceae bacterium]
MTLSRLVSCLLLVVPLAGCEDDSTSSTTTALPAVFIDSVFTTQDGSSQAVARPPERSALSSVDLPCDSLLGVRLSFNEEWTARAPGLCGSTLNCGHTSLTLTLAENESTLSVVSTPGMLTLTSPASWGGNATLKVELVHDDGTPYMHAGAVIGDELEVPLIPVDGCAE